MDWRAFGDCPVLRESHYCLVVAGIGERRVSVVGIDTETVCEGPALPEDDSGELVMRPSVAWLGAHLYQCGDRGLRRFSLANGAVESTTTECGGVAPYECGLLLARPLAGPAATLQFFPSFDHVRRGRPRASFWVDGHFSRLTAFGDRLFTAWHSTHEIALATLPSGDRLGTLRLGGYDGWIMGLSVTADGMLFVLGQEELMAFDARSGRRLKTLHLGRRLSAGLACELGPRASAPGDRTR